MAKKRMMRKNNAKKVKSAKTSSITDSINSEVIAAALSSVNQPIFLKVCRLCETKDGPFLNIFDADKITAKKIEIVMPFGIAENDDLPHKICFRCSAKVEELYEFIQKCINTQKSLRKAVGAKGPIINKPRHRELWEEKLNQSNISNDDICDALIKKAMEGIKDIPLNSVPLNEDKKLVTEKASNKPTAVKEDTQKKVLDDPQEEEEKINVPPKSVKIELNKFQQEPITKSLRSNAEKKTNESEKKAKSDEKDVKIVDKAVKSEKNATPTESASNAKKDSDKPILQTNTFSLDDTTKPQSEPTFNIMDHVSMIKVNGVGVLFQCKMCNRNFLKKEVVMSHACAKNGPSKIAGPKNFPPPEPPKIPSVKYINTKEVKKPVPTNIKENIIDLDDEDEDDKPLVTKKPKPKIGPASKVKRNNTSTTESSETAVSNNLGLINVKTNLSSTGQEPVLQFPTLPSLNSRYKLVPGPNNTFTLVEEKVPDVAPPPEKVENIPNVANTIVPNKDKPNNRQNVGTRRSITAGKSQNTSVTATPTKSPQLAPNQPYPVGLFKTLPSNTCPDVPIEHESVAFTTPAMKKQSYTVVQTGNPSKLLISSKPQAVVEEVPKKRQRKTKHEVKADLSNKQPFSVTLEDTAPPRDPGFFTFINVDPLLQPSYVLPTNNIIQESQISTSSSVVKQSEKEKEHKYTCNMCNETFTREKKLLAHIQSHYSKMDEEDQLRAEKIPRKRRK